MKTLFKAAGTIFWVLCMVVFAPFALIALDCFVWAMARLMRWRY